MRPELSEEQRALAHSRLAAGLSALNVPDGEDDRPERHDLRGRASGSRSPASYAARRMWFLDQLQAGSLTYLVPLALRLTGPLDRTAWEQSLRDLVDRHEVLRSTYSDTDLASTGDLTQVVADAIDIPTRHVDLTGYAERERADAWRHAIDADVRQPFDLRAGPLMRATLFDWTTSEHRLLLTLHHSCVDGWALGLLVRDLAALYAARTDQGAYPDPPKVSYRDFTLWRRERVESGALEDQLAYWTEHLADARATELPTDRRRPNVLGWHADRHVLTFDTELTAAIRRTATYTHSSTYTVLLAAFNALLHRYVGQDNVVVGTPVADRAHAEVEDVVGMVANTLVLRTDVSADPTFRDLIMRTRETVLDAHAHAEVPFELLVEKLAPERDPARQPLFQIAFILQNLPPFDRVRAGDLTLERLELPVAAAKFDLTVTLTEVGEPGGSCVSTSATDAAEASDYPGLRCALEYSTELFARDTIERFAQHFRTCAQAALADPDRPISAIPLLEQEERELLRQWSRSDGERARTAPSVPDRVEHRIAEAPAALAIRDEREALTYTELGAQADRVAAHLVGLGAGPEDLIGVCVDRSAELAVALLGVLRSGAGYVALDPAYPSERLNQMISDAQPFAVLSEEDAVGRFTHRRVPVLSLRHLRQPDPAASSPPARRPADSTPRCQVHPGQRAYVVYTSGSTGQPKGVEIEHAGLANLVEWHLRAYQLRPDDAVTLFASPGFDASTMELWTGLSSGATVHVPAEELRSEPVALARWLVDEGITSTMLPTATAEALVASAGRDLAGSRLRFLHTAGDALSALPYDVGVPIVNHYGPSENSVEATATDSTGLPVDGRRPPIGRPITGVTAYVLDNTGAPAPIGLPGELYLGGSGVARGYLGDPDRTARQFVPDPFAEASNARMYRTGDLARWLPDGQLDFLGRTDRQVTIRGHRVELGEAEAAVRAHPAVREAVVLARGEDAADRDLVAVCVLNVDSSAVNADELRVAVRLRLPAPMVPTSYVVVDRIPQTRGGKLNRRAVRWQDGRPLERRTTLDPPRTPTERALAELWSELLGVTDINRGDNFFELGGHSFLALRLQRRIRTRLGAQLPVVELFQHPVLAALSERIDTRVAYAPADDPDPAIRSGRPERRANNDAGARAEGRRDARGRIAARRRSRGGEPR